MTLTIVSAEAGQLRQAPALENGEGSYIAADVATACLAKRYIVLQEKL